MPALKEEAGWRRVLNKKRARTKDELIEDMRAELRETVLGVDWNFSQYIRDNVMESLSGVKGDNSVKIIGPDLHRLEELAEKTKKVLKTVHGVEDVGIFRVQGQPALEFPPDREASGSGGPPAVLGIPASSARSCS